MGGKLAEEEQLTFVDGIMASSAHPKHLPSLISQADLTHSRRSHAFAPVSAPKR